MAHGVLNLVYDHQSGRRGDDKAFVRGHADGHGAAARSATARCSSGRCSAPTR